LQAALDLLFAPAFTLGGAAFTWLEIVAFVLSVWMVVCNIRVDPTGWPLAIVSSLLYFALFWKSRLYGDASLQIVFVIVAGWGWRQWLRGSSIETSTAPEGLPEPRGERLPVRSMTTRGIVTTVVALLVMWPLIGLFLKRYTDTDVPWFDAFPTSASLIGQFLLGRKFVENWPTWVAVNAVSVGLFAYKGLWLTVLLYAIFLAMSFIGWKSWRKLAGAQQSPDASVAATA
jgi:nicotinamide mononucleotide transporter